MDYSTMAIVMAMVTLCLIVAEFFVPSGGMITIMAVICGVISVWGGWQAWARSSPILWWTYLGTFFTLLPATIVIVVTILPRTPYGKRILLEPVSQPQSRAYQDEQSKLSQMVGKTGRTATLHTPGGIVIIDGRRYHSESEGLLIEPETDVVVLAVKGNRLLIREGVPDVETEQAPSLEVQEAERAADGIAAADENLDFQVPEG